MKKSIIIFTLMSFIFSQGLLSQEEKCKDIQLNAGFDMATTYLWRGFEFGNGPVIQPWAQVSYKNLAVGVWSTTNFIGDSKEVDLFMKYTIKDFTVSFTDLFSVGIPGLDQNYFNFANSSTGHIAELGLSYASPGFPLTLSGGVFVYGLALDPQNDDPSRLNHSTYFELGYPGTFRDFSYSLFAGFVPTKSSFYQTEQFSFINVGFNLSKSIEITDKFALPLTLTLAASPERKTTCFALKCSL